MPAMMCVCTCSDLAPSMDHVLNGVTSVAMVPNRPKSTFMHTKKAGHISVQSHISSNKISIPNMKKATKKKTSTTSPVGRFGKKTKAGSPMKITVGTPKKATQKGGRVVKKTKAESPKKSTAETPKKAKQKGKGSTGAKTGKPINTRPSLQTPDRQ